ncbi:AAA family ATPase [Streptomyces qinzhouensis]|uniref:AAA family ATPase n=1 Tax=Streptomyces qinzhouensis TaxID=2599401 RepID=A0A5B8IKU6_9ACTN|nr:AAA family ATPase [Streptomyces qinzhouensis]QDY79138.1 AAA family ATPase [Streptomyces qinzhouensis]
MTLQRSSAYATTAGVPAQPGAPVRERVGAHAPPVLRDLRGRAGRGPRALTFAAGDLVVVSGLPGSGKSTLIKRAVAAAGARPAAGSAPEAVSAAVSGPGPESGSAAPEGAGPEAGPGAAGDPGSVCGIDSQDTRDRWDAAVPRLLPYALYRPFVRLAHYAGLRRALRSGRSVVVHDCGTQAWVRRWLAREARRRGTGLHLMLLDVPPEVARQGQEQRGRGVSGYAFARHRRAAGRLIADAEAGRAPAGCASVILLDRPAATALARIGFTAG